MKSMNLSSETKKEEGECDAVASDDDDVVFQDASEHPPTTVQADEEGPEDLPVAQASTATTSSENEISAQALLRQINAARNASSKHVDIEEKGNNPNVTGATDKSSALRPSPRRQSPRRRATNEQDVNTPDSSDDEQDHRKKKQATLPPQKNMPPRGKDIPTSKKKVCLGEVLPDSPLVTQAPVGPPLDPDNAVNRYVLVGVSEFGGDPNEIAGWVGKILKVAKSNKSLTAIQFQDKKCYFEFAYVQTNFKPLT